MEEHGIRKLAEFIHDITWEQLPEAVKEAAVFRVLDLISVAGMPLQPAVYLAVPLHVRSC